MKSEEIKVKVPKTYAFGTLEAPPRFELGHKGFAGLCLTTWLWCREKNGHNVEYKVPDGADYETRTRYLHLGKVALYRMSYTRIMVPPVGVEPTTRGFSVRCSTY